MTPLLLTLVALSGCSGPAHPTHFECEDGWLQAVNGPLCVKLDFTPVVEKRLTEVLVQSTYVGEKYRIVFDVYVRTGFTDLTCLYLGQIIVAHGVPGGITEFKTTWFGVVWRNSIRAKLYIVITSAKEGLPA